MMLSIMVEAQEKALRFFTDVLSISLAIKTRQADEDRGLPIGQCVSTQTTTSTPSA
jgi:hypothetical protein